MENTYIKYNEMVNKINALSDEEIESLIKNDKCPYQPELIPKNITVGMHHCRICGEMVVAGFPHPRK